MGGAGFEALEGPHQPDQFALKGVALGERRIEGDFALHGDDPRAFVADEGPKGREKELEHRGVSSMNVVQDLP
jgi:hypothetical protein